jgi:acetyl/propionyl-CoA carboxylase alpha subunit
MWNVPRHIEFQVIGDTHGNMIHLGERECSVQRRHQKIIEESPSQALTTAHRMELGGKIVRALQSVGYVNAGTVELLMDEQGRTYFMEVNTASRWNTPSPNR